MGPSDRLQAPLFAAAVMSSSGIAATVEQNQRAFQKQDNIFVGKKRVLGSKKLGIKTPSAAIAGTYVDKKCPWTGSVNIRGKMLTGIIKTAKMKNTVIVRKDYLHYIKKY